MTGWEYSYGADHNFSDTKTRRYTLYMERERHGKKQFHRIKMDDITPDVLLSNKRKLNNNNDIILTLIEHFQFHGTV